MNNEEFKSMILNNRHSKIAILSELHDGLVNYFSSNPDQTVKITFSFKPDSIKKNHFIEFESSLDHNKDIVFSNVFHFLHKAVSLFDPEKSPFGYFARYLMDHPQSIDLVFDQDNFMFIFDYSDDFDGKDEWLETLD